MSRHDIDGKGRSKMKDYGKGKGTISSIDSLGRERTTNYSRDENGRAVKTTKAGTGHVGKGSMKEDKFRRAPEPKVSATTTRKQINKGG